MLRVKRHAQAGAHRDGLPMQQDRPAQRGEDAFGHRLPGVRVRQVRQQHDELIPADSRDRVAGAEFLSQPPRQSPQHLIARRMPQPVIDRLEAVEIDEQQRQPTEWPAAPANAFSRRWSNRRRFGSPVRTSCCAA